MNQITKSIIQFLKSADFLDLDFLLEPTPIREDYGFALVRSLYDKGGDALLGVYIDCVFNKFLDSNEIGYRLLLDSELVREKRNRLVTLNKEIGDYHSQSGGLLIKKSILSVANSIKDSEIPDFSYYDSEPYKSIMKSNDFIDRDLVLKSTGDIDLKPILSTQFDKLLYVFKSPKAALEFVNQAKDGLYVLCIKDEEKAANIHFMVGVKFSNGGGVVLSDGNYNPNKKSRSDRSDIHRIEKSFFPYSLSDVVFDNLHINNSASSFELMKTDAFNHSDFLGFKELKSMSEHDAIRLSIFINQLFGLDWQSYISKFKEAEESYTVEVGQFDPKSPSTSLSVQSKEVLLPNIATRESFRKALNIKGKNVYGDDFEAKTTLSNAYWEAVFSSDIDSVLISNSKLIESASGVKNTVLVAVENSSAMTSYDDVVINTLKTARAEQAKKLKDSINDYFDSNHKLMREWIGNISNQPQTLDSILEKVARLENLTDAYDNVDKDMGKYLCCMRVASGTRIEAFESNGYRAVSGGSVVPDCVVSSDSSYHCIVNGSKAKYCFIYEFNDCFDMSSMFGVAIEKLPYHLSQFGVNISTANSILNDVDPVESMTHNFAQSSRYNNRLGLAIPLSLSGFNSLRKKHGLEKLSRSELQDLAKEKEYRPF